MIITIFIRRTDPIRNKKQFKARNYKQQRKQQCAYTKLHVMWDTYISVLFFLYSQVAGSWGCEARSVAEVRVQVPLFGPHAVRDAGEHGSPSAALLRAHGQQAVHQQQPHAQHG